MSFASKPSYLHNVTNSFPEVRKLIDRFLHNWLSKNESDPPKELFHYTTLDGLKGILSSRSIWFSHVSSLNDPLELKYGRNLIKKTVTEYAKYHNEDKFFNKLKFRLDSFGGVYHPFIACFCEEGDLLSQWRAYADRGGGYSIGFKFSSTAQLASDIDNLENSQPLYLRKVIYEPHNQRMLIENYLEKVFPGVKKQIRIRKKDSRDLLRSGNLIKQVLNPLLDFMFCFKHPAFKEEKEWRLIRITEYNFEKEKLKFRENNNSLIPYRSQFIYEYDNASINDPNDYGYKFPCNSIICGPSSEIDNEVAIRLYLQHLSSKNNPISITPTRIKVKNAGYTLK